MKLRVPIYLNDGCGVESFSIALRWHLEPESRYFMLAGHKVYFDWDQVTALTAQTGGEDRLTRYLNEQYKLPIYREENVRYVQVARAGPREQDGIVILSDSRQEEQLYTEGAYTLADELKVSGTVPAFGGGVHLCSQKYKAYVSDTFITFDLHEPTACSRDPEGGHVCRSCAERLGLNPAPTPRRRKSPKKRKRDRLDALELFTPAGDSAAAEPEAAPEAPQPILPVMRVFGYNADERSRIAESDRAFGEFNRRFAGLAFGYNKDEARRIRESDAAIHQYNERHALPPDSYASVFGFNAGEVSRLREAKRYDVAPRIGIYPLELWGWSRQDALDYIRKHLGINFVRSRCSFCPFNRLTDDDLERHKSHPSELADALLVEFIALAINPRSTLYPNRSLYSIAVEHDMRLGLDEFDRHVESCEWALYRVRRIYYPKGGDTSLKGKTDRAVEKLETGTRAQMAAAFSKRARGLMVERHHNHLYAYARHRSETLFPTGEEFYVTCPSTVETKARYSMDRFDQRWYSFVAPDPARLSAGQATLNI